MTVKYLFASHGTFADGTVSFLSIMMGKNENIYSICCYLDDRSAELQIETEMKAIGDFDQLIVFCDMHGSSVEQSVFRLLHDDPRILIISGYNIPLVLNIIAQEKVLSKVEIRDMIQEAQSGMMLLEAPKIPSPEEEGIF